MDSYAVCKWLHSDYSSSPTFDPSSAAGAIESAMRELSGEKVEEEGERVLDVEATRRLLRRAERHLTPRDVLKWAERVKALRCLERERSRGGAVFFTEEVRG